MAGVQALAAMLTSDASPSNIALHLSDCQLGNNGVNVLVETMMQGKLKSVMTLSLSHNGIDVNGAANLCPLISDKRPTMLDLSLSQNNIGSDGFKLILSAVKQSTSLQELRLTVVNCNINNDGLIALAETLSTDRCPTMMSVDLRDNTFDANGLAAISNALINRNDYFNHLSFIFSGHGFDDACRNVVLDMMMRSTNVTGIHHWVAPADEDVSHKEWKEKIDICCRRNRFIRLHPDLKDFILARCAKAGFYTPGASLRSPSLLSTLAAFSLLSTLDPLGVREKKLLKYPDINLFLIKLDQIAECIKEEANKFNKPK